MITVNVPEEDKKEIDELEAFLKHLFKTEIFLPLIEEEKEIFTNQARTPLEKAIAKGDIKFNAGRFSGKFNSQTSRELKTLGATWDRRTKTYKLLLSKIPKSTQAAIAVSETRFASKIESIKRKLRAIIPAKIAGKFDAFSFFNKLIQVNDVKIGKSLDGLIVSPRLTEEARTKLAEQYTENFQRSVKGWTEDEIKKLRGIVQDHATKGLRAESLIKKIKRRFDVSQSRAKFIARQETRLVMSKFRETRYQDAGTKGYVWKTVLGTPAHPVRPLHAKLDGKFFKWDNPPVTNVNGNRNHPGEDFNCRCRPKVVVRF